MDIEHHGAIVTRLRRQAKADLFRLTLHGHQEMAEENILVSDVQEALSEARVIENYPEHKRGVHVV